VAEEEGATMTSKHPKRCETCTNDECDFNEDRWGSTWHNDIYYFMKKCGCASHSSASEPVPDSATLIEYAQREWANREERRGIHEKVSWETGWMSGYLTSEGNIQQARQQERERVLSCVQEDVNDLTKEVAHGLYTNQGIFEELQKLSRRIESLRQQEES